VTVAEHAFGMVDEWNELGIFFCAPPPCIGTVCCIWRNKLNGLSTIFVGQRTWSEGWRATWCPKYAG
jgi:hypothetical protein